MCNQAPSISHAMRPWILTDTTSCIRSGSSTERSHHEGHELRHRGNMWQCCSLSLAWLLEVAPGTGKQWEHVILGTRRRAFTLWPRSWPLVLHTREQTCRGFVVQSELLVKGEKINTLHLIWFAVCIRLLEFCQPMKITWAPPTYEGLQRGPDIPPDSQAPL